MRNKKTIPKQGHSSSTTIDGDRVKKRVKVGGNERLFSKQAELWNLYYANTCYNSALVAQDDKGEVLSLPFIEGRYPSKAERLHGLITMQKKGYAMGDCSEEKNFIVSGTDVYPVDFGLIYYDKEQPLPRAYGINQQRFDDEIKTLTDNVEDEFNTKKEILLRKLEQLDEYKNKKLLTNKEKSAAIDFFIIDTRKRIDKFSNEEYNAFSDYIERNQSSISILQENRQTGAIWKSILLVLCTGIIPALVGGAIQAAMTHGNSFLFFTKKDKSRQLAKDIQETISSMDLNKTPDEPDCNLELDSDLKR